MKSLLISLLFIFTLNAQNVWYVDRDATGSANGTSWTNAWNNINNINWASISSGDTIYFSGGTYSGAHKIYPSVATYGALHLVVRLYFALLGKVDTMIVCLSMQETIAFNGC